MGQLPDIPQGPQFEHNYTASVGTCAAGPVNPATKFCPLGIVPVVRCGGESGRTFGLPAGLFA